MKDYSGQILADKYRIDSLLQENENGLGELYLATHLLMDKPVTIKILAPALAVDSKIAESFLAEAKKLSRLSHPNILGVTDTGTDKSGALFIVFEVADGETLETVIKNEGAFSLERANRIIRQVAAALSVAHHNDIIHHNLTSRNILLTKNSDETDHVKLINFSVDENFKAGDVSAYDAAYLSPEQCSQTRETDSRSDVYSLGIILYQMLAGEVPFLSDKTSDVMLKQTQEPPLPLSAFRDDLPTEVSTVIVSALAKNPELRYQTPNELAAAFNRATMVVSGGTGTAATSYNFVEPSPQQLAAAIDGDQNNIWKTAFIVLAGVAVLSAFFIYMTQVKQTNPTTQLQPDANGQPVQPVNPPIGTSEQSLANMGGYSPEVLSNINSAVMNGTTSPQVMPGGDGYDPWARGGVPPPGAPPQQQQQPMYVAPGGGVYDGTVNPNSPFMQDGNTYILVPKNSVNSNVATQPGKKNANANTQTAPPVNTKQNPPSANTSVPSEAKPTPATTAPKTTKPTPKPTAQPKSDSSKTSPSGKQTDSQEK